MAANTCYCCSDKGKTSEEMDLDEALNELGMLSTVTESRKQYLREKQTTSRVARLYKNMDNRQQGKKKIGVIHFNPEYIAKVTIGSNQPSSNIWIQDTFEENNLDFFKNYQKRTESIEADMRSRRLERYRLGRIRRFRRPYEVPWRLMEPLPSNVSQENDSLEPQSKSNSSSPIKYTSSSSSSSSCSLTRSRSFDNLNFAMLKIASDILEETNFSLCKQEIETVSANMRNLQVTE
ncbi:Hypothetical predicted protein [Octopus vulgaris]|uniref:Uncharacterized protein n=3 Tax=Octopus TaxID=6643 RepID=A0AA36B8D9_OCTVU|nr:uncharacterized protein LOC106869465 [Octopus bimaculoides]XP_014770701.1 uncharacterized protein LOC106869465 [Octopus bimaculoides]XP_014770702.1 uncharacterized protein LOC106869465 [Octopus bimaculoides]XP_014770703.1 uncharacterized protein LOC106869465 [Octopus bimaculoides]XP_014770704.1 uncharacterized protein LOC106869465 [Octopus bimaculoides]XP_029641109.1 uncharacterized protein LOC115215897 [Octopus sinensis]XP_029641110.1 uncharacterized protein LOC115215897 [Octopus sinensis|eukprot:XP_014770700.1 PREDICTED: uncharacterized protein LOC106869465 [Octopus bimaculoides]